MRKRNSIVLAGITALLAVGAIAATADEDRSNPPSNGVGQVTAVEPEAAEAVSLLAQPRTAIDELDGDLAGDMHAEADFGLNPGLSRLAIGNATSSVYVLPARDHVCVALTVGEGASVICPPTDDVADGRAAPATVYMPSGGVAVYGVVPDGVDEVVLGIGASATTTLEVTDNAYYAVVPTGTVLRTLSYDGPSGPVEFPLVDPSE